MTVAPWDEVDRVHIGLVRKVVLGASVVSLVAVLSLAFFNRPLAVGVGLGGGFMVALTLLYRALAVPMFAAPERRRSRALFWLAWLLKWPALCGALYLAFESQAAAPVGVALGSRNRAGRGRGAGAPRVVLVDVWAKWRGGLRAS